MFLLSVPGYPRCIITFVDQLTSFNFAHGISRIFAALLMLHYEENVHTGEPCACSWSHLPGRLPQRFQSHFSLGALWVRASITEERNRNEPTLPAEFRCCFIYTSTKHFRQQTRTNDSLKKSIRSYATSGPIKPCLMSDITQLLPNSVLFL